MEMPMKGEFRWELASGLWTCVLYWGCGKADVADLRKVLRSLPFY